MKNELLHFIPNVPSTNRLLAKMVTEAAQDGEALPEFFTLYTDFQSAGHGMGSNSWFSDKDQNLLVSFYFEPKLPANRQFIFNRYFALTTLSFIRQYAPNALIKWPNDIYINGKKMAGDLTEHTLRGDKIRYTIAGIGININQDHFPTDVPHPTSLFLETKQHYDLPSLLETYWNMLHENYHKVSLADDLILHDEYLHNLYQYHEFHHYLIHNEEIEASIINLDSYGRLLLEDHNGKTYLCGFKEIVFL